jgi:hypothetical protein
VFLTAVGCGPSRPARIPAPPLDPVAVAEAALGGSGPFDAAALAKVPALAAALPLLDKNGDKKLSRDELVSWLTEVRDSKVAITSLAVEVKHKGRPVKNARVRFVPEAFMASVKQAEGTTDDSGVSMVSIPGSEYPGVNCGLYRVEITGQGNDGKPLAAKYNTATTLGVAVGGMLPENGMVSYVLE